jgi:hypothetical protein
MVASTDLAQFAVVRSLSTLSRAGHPSPMCHPGAGPADTQPAGAGQAGGARFAEMTTRAALRRVFTPTG